MNPRFRPPPIVTNSHKLNVTPIKTTPQNRTLRTNSFAQSTTPKYLKPSPRSITPKNMRPVIPKEVVTPTQLYVISDSGKLVKPHSPLGPPPPLKPLPRMKRPVCKNPNKKI